MLICHHKSKQLGCRSNALATSLQDRQAVAMAVETHVWGDTLWHLRILQDSSVLID